MGSFASLAESEAKIIPGVYPAPKVLASSPQEEKVPQSVHDFLTEAREAHNSMSCWAYFSKDGAELQRDMGAACHSGMRSLNGRAYYIASMYNGGPPMGSREDAEVFNVGRTENTLRSNTSHQTMWRTTEGSKLWAAFITGPQSPYLPILGDLLVRDVDYIANKGFIFKANKKHHGALYHMMIASRQPYEQCMAHPLWLALRPHVGDLLAAFLSGTYRPTTPDILGPYHNYSLCHSYLDGGGKMAGRYLDQSPKIEEGLSSWAMFQSRKWEYCPTQKELNERRHSWEVLHQPLKFGSLDETVAWVMKAAQEQRA